MLVEESQTSMATLTVSAGAEPLLVTALKDFDVVGDHFHDEFKFLFLHGHQ